MIPVKETYDQIERGKLVGVRLFDGSGNKIEEFIAKDSDGLIEHLKEIHKLFKFYGKCDMWCANEKQSKANFSGCFKWKVTFADEKTAAVQVNGQPTSMAGQMKETMELLIMMKTAFGPNNDQNLQQQLMDAKLEAFKAENSIAVKKMEMENENPEKKYGWITPLALMGMGKSADEIKSFMGLMQMGRVAGKNGEQVLAVTNEKTTFENLEKMSNEKKNKKIEELMDKMYKVVSAEHFIMLLEIILEKPSRVSQAITAANQGII